MTSGIWLNSNVAERGREPACDPRRLRSGHRFAAHGKKTILPAPFSPRLRLGVLHAQDVALARSHHITAGQGKIFRSDGNKKVARPPIFSY